MELTVVESLRKVRTKLNQKELALALGMSHSSYKRLVMGESEPTISDIERFAKYFKVSEDVIRGRVDPFESKAEEPEVAYRSKKQVSILVELDGTIPTLNEWFGTLTKLNGALR